MQLLRVLAMTLAAPIVGGVASILILTTHGGAAAARSLGLVSLFGGLIPLVLIGLQLGGSAWAGQRREAMAAVFPILARLTIAALALMVVVQAAIVILCFWAGEDYMTGGVHIVVILALGIGAMGMAVALLKAILASTRRPGFFAVGKVLTPQAAPGLFAHVSALAAKLGAPAPRHIVVGLEPTFYVTHADVALFGHGPTLRGKTLYLSATLARLLTPAEMDAVIGHELGHFRGQDAAYSLKFAPVYVGLGEAIWQMSDEDGQVDWAAVPTLEMLSFLYEAFKTNVAAVDRVREMEADRAGVEAASAQALGLALMKVTMHGAGWHEAMQRPAFVRDHDKALNLSAAFLARIAGGFSDGHARGALEPLLAERMAHPLDTHPPIGERLEAIAVDPRSVDPASLGPPVDGASAAEMIDGLRDLEVELSQMEYHFRELAGTLPPTDARRPPRAAA